MTVVPLTEMSDDTRTEYARWLWWSVRMGKFCGQDVLLELEKQSGDLWINIRARRRLAREADSVRELGQFLDLLALWPDQPEKLRCYTGNLLLPYNQRRD